MKLKYYLRGIGIGVIVATLIMSISSVIHNNNLSEETIIKEAQKLGMVMPENTEDKDSLWEKNTEDVTDEMQTGNFETNTSETTSSETEDMILSGTETETQGGDDSEGTQEPEDTGELEEPVYVSITVDDTDGARKVAIKLKEAGAIESAEDFHAYLKENGYERTIRSGRHTVPVGASYEKICDIIMKK